MFDNILLLAPDDQPIGRLSKKKANWYISRGLAEELKEKVVRLTFEPSGRTVICERDLEEKENHCVVCNTTDELTKHHIVPYCFRKHMPFALKSKASFDVVSICQTCHAEYHKHTNELVEKLRKEKGLRPLNQKVKKLRVVKGLVDSLKHKALIPEDRVAFMKEQVNSALNINIDDFTLSDLSQKIKEQIDAIDESKELVEIVNLEEFVVLWRKHFIDVMNPPYLSQTWLNEIHIVPWRG